MTTEQKSDSINFDNEQVEQRTLGSDEEREIKQPEENKTNTKSGERKNKSQNRFNKIKLPPIKRSKKGQPIYKGLDPPAANINNYSNIMNQNFVEDEEFCFFKTDILISASLFGFFFFNFFFFTPWSFSIFSLFFISSSLSIIFSLI